MSLRVAVVLVALALPLGLGAPLGGCGSKDAAATVVPAEGGAAGADASDEGGAGEGDAGADGTAGPGTLVRVMVANITNGPALDYAPAESTRIFQGLHPDVVMLQEFNTGASSKAELDAFVATAFGATFTYYREVGAQIPNGIISRYPILASGSWVDPQVANRGFAYAKLALPGPHPLWAVSLHLLTTGVTQRAAEATALVAQIKAVVPVADYLVVGGDLNTETRDETCISTLAEIVTTAGPFPDDGAGNDNTSATRTHPHDWLFADPDLAAFRVPVAIGQRSFAAGLVFDSRVYMPIADVAPVQATDSAAQNMQHMPVVRDFHPAGP